MSTIEIAHPTLTGDERSIRGGSGGPALARLAAACGAVALACAALPVPRWAALAALAAAGGCGVAARMRSRAGSAENRVTAWAGLMIAIAAAVGLIASSAAFGSVTSGHPRAAAPAPAPAAPAAAAAAPAPLDLSSTTSLVLSRDINVVFGTPHTELDDTGLVMVTEPVTITNISGHNGSFDLQFVARDAQGKLITTDSATVPDVAAGQAAQIRVFNIVNSVLVPQLMSAHYSVVQAVAH